MIKLQKNILKKQIIGIIPVRMAASRFPGKPLKKILGITMLRHVYERAKLFNNWHKLVVATCDKEIYQYCASNKIQCVMTSKKHKRCLDRVYEAAKKIIPKKNNQLIICVQGDEPMLEANMINALIKPIEKIKDAKCTVLAMDIIEKTQYYNKDIVKIIHNKNGEVLYTSRSPVPYCKKFNKKIKAKRVGGLFAFRWNFLKKFYNTKESFLEKIESCDSNRICDNGGGQYIAHYKYKPYFSVDSPGDLKIVNKYMKKDKIYKKYKYLSISE